MTPVEQALSEYQTPNSFWPSPLINSLQEVADHSALIEWVANSLLVVLANKGHPLADTIAKQATIAKGDLCANDTIERLIDSWSDSHPSDDIVRCHMHLLLARKNLLEDKEIKYRSSVVWALMFLCNCENAIDQQVPIVIDEYQKILAARGRSTCDVGDGGNS